ncbi:hypothetical protein PGT21_029508 [Puccinia graminis f. sp. tritici]|uniref:Uncharacterized protein n=1 Tax=Puccinia graminis f. sp. tritici TaxID=56615 RepID=A0A5B0Q6X4_PUCGR|nr:hypothetical protein PGT21_029508 [Puccinia graminis f. sp. tritici]KAA1122443.1 hypothetical protein PGTUg99_037611 [Puccinia graminis f. sp. tritici]
MLAALPHPNKIRQPQQVDSIYPQLDRSDFTIDSFHSSYSSLKPFRKTDMQVHQAVFLIASCLLHACRSYDTSDPNIKCVPKIQTGRANCKSAYAKIIYESDSTLDQNERHVQRISGNCAVMVDKPLNVKITRQTIEDGFAKMLGHCKEHPGTYTLPDFQGVTLSTRERLPYPRIEADTPNNQLTCYGTKDHTTPDDCAAAYNALPTNSDGLFTNQGSTCTSVNHSFKSCNVLITSSDASAMTITKTDATPIIYKIISTCNGKWGGMAVQNGVLGRNGRIVVILSPTGQYT